MSRTRTPAEQERDTERLLVMVEHLQQSGYDERSIDAALREAMGEHVPGRTRRLRAFFSRVGIA
jgi:hypothetical protein